MRCRNLRWQTSPEIQSSCLGSLCLQLTEFRSQLNDRPCGAKWIALMHCHPSCSNTKDSYSYTINNKHPAEIIKKVPHRGTFSSTKRNLLTRTWQIFQNSRCRTYAFPACDLRPLILVRGRRHVNRCRQSYVLVGRECDEVSSGRQSHT